MSFCNHFSLVVCVTVTGSVVKEILCCAVPVVMRIIVLPEYTDPHRVIWSLLKTAFATPLLSHYADENV